MEELTQFLLETIQKDDYKPRQKEELFALLNLTDKSAFEQALLTLEQQGEIIYSKRGKILSLAQSGYIAGDYSSSERGYGFVIPSTPTTYGDLFIPARDTLGAMHNDRVIARANMITKEGRADGTIIKIVKRNTKTLTGTFEQSHSHGFVVPDNKKFCNDIYIGKKGFNGAKDGEKVLVEIKTYSTGSRNAEGVIAKVFGKAQSRHANYEAVLFDKNVRTSFPQETLSMADHVPQQVQDKDIKDRLDLRNETIFTIDGADAKDFDDAVSLKVNEKGNYELGVHIADVSHYVTEGSPLDTEAYRRGTSIYFVDQVVPMLPIALSNGICSLNPKVDRLTFSTFMEFDPEGNRLDFSIKKTVIKSCERLIYKDVTAVIEETASPEITKKYAYLKDTFLLMAKLSQILRKKRRMRGAIDFDLAEAKIIVDETGEPVDIIKRERGVSEKMIEDFMLAANEAVAEYVFWQEQPFVYRVHEKPDPEKITSFFNTASLFGISFPRKNNDIEPKQLQDILEKLKGKPFERSLSTLALRSMKKARYFEQNLGHFGLAAKYYCHFTSPIRRYPDLSIHRILTDLLEGKIDSKRRKSLEAFAADSSKQSSDCEINAIEAERDIDDLYKAIYMKKFIGQEFSGVISSVMAFGMFVELPNTVEGLVNINALDDDFYLFDQERLCLTGEHTKKTYQIGDPIDVVVAATNIVSRQIDFVLKD